MARIVAGVDLHDVAAQAAAEWFRLQCADPGTRLYAWYVENVPRLEIAHERPSAAHFPVTPEYLSPALEQNQVAAMLYGLARRLPLLPLETEGGE